ncbi:MAG: 50S ribosomal protein L35 [Caldisericia bacterium]|jgi:large subunit ribosomal protein L35|nr:50S ribosomal protein L35 [Caldisericia bacterium]MDD3427448.1 50S ribosomal protein L35 [Caldisericia bacterium]MDD5689291.1 50S ribosomal protein L35 [Caldisericia bacterium]HOJ16375.1 bL35 family ribosomal protein [Caldisericia bacterium]HOW03164.1 bL35 family ribosomal protein [Caldisericia bacterium]
MKLYSRKTAKKRFKITGSGKILRLPTGHSHHLEKKDSRKKTAQLRQVEVSKNDFKTVKKIIQ